MKKLIFLIATFVSICSCDNTNNNNNVVQVDSDTITTCRNEIKSVDIDMFDSDSCKVTKIYQSELNTYATYIIELNVRNERHEYVLTKISRYLGGMEHLPNCKYCTKKDNTAIDYPYQNPEGNPEGF